jgi:hypothetical protein
VKIKVETTTLELAKNSNNGYNITAIDTFLNLFSIPTLHMTTTLRINAGQSFLFKTATATTQQQQQQHEKVQSYGSNMARNQ